MGFSTMSQNGQNLEERHPAHAGPIGIGGCRHRMLGRRQVLAAA